ncbi:MAG: hypothetical protein ACI9PP_001340 [Halobacteriales archaeon]|jgi:hypothetical protein
MTASITDIVLLVLAFGIVFGGLLLFVATVDHRTHCTVEERFEKYGGEYVRYYSELDPNEQDVFNQLVAQQDETVTNNACEEGVIRYNETYYRINSWTTIIWTNPLTLASLGISAIGIGFLGVLIRKQVR